MVAIRQFIVLSMVLAALSVMVGCPGVPPTSDPSDGVSTTDDPSTSDPDNNNDVVDDSPIALPTGSISGRLLVQTDTTEEEAKTLEGGSQKQLATTDAADADDFVPGELLVRFDEALSWTEREALLADCGMVLLQGSPSGVCRVGIEARSGGGYGKDVLRQRASTIDGQALLRGRAGIRRVERNGRRWIARVPSDELFDVQWHYSVINLPAAWELTTGSDDVIVAIVDTGIRTDHPDLQGRLVDGYDFIDDPAAARDGDGRDEDPTDPGDQFSGPGQSSFHGTHVAGTIAATTNNGIGVAGVTWQTRIMPLRALGIDGGTVFDVSEAIRYAAGLPNVSGEVPARRADIINLSIAGLPGEAASDTELDALQAASDAGVLVVAAAGNNGSSLPSFPAADARTISVGAVDIQLERAIYSNWGPTIDLAGPGGFAGTDINGDGFGDGVLSTGASDVTGEIELEYILSNGTSMATPHVSGVAALMLAVDPDLTADGIREILAATALDLGESGRDDDFGAGLVDAAAAVRETLARAGGSPMSEPMLSLSHDVVDFGTGLERFDVRISNSGGGVLEVTAAEVVEDDGEGWLTASLVGSTDNATATAVRIGVDRSDLAEGIYRGTVTVRAEGVPDGVIDVAMSVGPGASLGEFIYVLALDPETLETVEQSATLAVVDFAYQIDELPPGDYAVYAGTDRDNNGFICETGDLCGALPSRLEPEILTLEVGEDVTGADFSVARLILEQSVSVAQNLPQLKRLR